MIKRILLLMGAVYVFAQGMATFMDGFIDTNSLYNYENQEIPNFVNSDLAPFSNQITDEIATLGRVLFYDKKLSLNESISCASCHLQEFAFGDTAVVSKGFDGILTERHAMRLININYGTTDEVFWDERGAILEDQPSMTLSNSIEMGFSGENGQPDLDSLISRLENVSYYNQLFEFVYGDNIITIDRVDKAISQFVRSIVSFDSKFDEGMLAGGSPFFGMPNYTSLESEGLQLFFTPFGPPLDPSVSEIPDSTFFFACHNCHDFPNMSQTKTQPGNNGVTGIAGDDLLKDYSVVRAPSLRNIFTPDGSEIGPFMHDGSLKNLREVLEHYSLIEYDENNDNIAPIFNLFPGQDHHTPMGEHQKDAVIAFLKTLTGEDVFTNPKWSDPFDVDGNIEIIGEGTSTTKPVIVSVAIYPNPTTDIISIEAEIALYKVEIFNVAGQLIDQRIFDKVEYQTDFDVSHLVAGIYLVKCHFGEVIAFEKVIVE